MKLKKALSFVFECENKVMIILFLFYVFGFIFGTVHSFQNGVQAVDSFDSAFNEGIKEIFLKNFFLIFIIFLCGFAVFGLPIILFSVLYSGISVGVLFSSVVVAYGFKGSFALTVFGFVYFLIQLCCILFVSFSSLRLSIVLFNVFRNDTRCVSPKIYLLPHLAKFLVFMLLSFLSSVYYVFIAKVLIKLIL